MEKVSSPVVILETYTAQYADPIALRAGEAVHVGRTDPEFPEWFWCRGSDGREGWVHVSYLSHTTGQVTAVRDYSAQELTVAARDEARLIHIRGGWAYLALDDGRCGWVPEAIIQAPI